MDNLQTYLYISAILFSLGLYGVITRRNGIAVLMGVELILNSANINFVAFARFGGMNFSGQVFALFVIIMAAAEVYWYVPARRNRLETFFLSFPCFLTQTLTSGL